MKSAVVIVPTVASAHLTRALDSVAAQTYPTRLLVVSDGLPKGTINVSGGNADVLELPRNVGAKGFYGHRVYASVPHLVDEDYVFFLDEDNWYEPTHVESLISTIENAGVTWGFSLRNVHDKTGFVCQDNCESLGHHPVWTTLQAENKEFHVDTSAFAFRREMLVQTCGSWHFGYGADRRFLKVLKGYGYSNFVCSGEYTLNYSLGSSQTSPKADYFKNGNEFYLKTTEGKLPWQRT
jgi:glycosyltransferase involved in cell wall biosynthesis